MSIKSLLGCVEDGWKDKAEFKETSQQPLFFFFFILRKIVHDCDSGDF